MTSCETSNPVEKNLKRACITLDLERDYGRIEKYSLLNDSNSLENLCDIIKKKNVKLTIFIACEVLEKYPNAINQLEDIQSEFEVHSYSHDPNQPLETEIRLAKKSYFEYFGKRPMGYRSPFGRITRKGIQLLSENGFKYDSSIFPSIRPNVYSNLGCPTSPFLIKDTDLVEIPISVVPTIRLPIILSYIKFFGFSAYKFFFKFLGLPEMIIFDMHLHNLYNAESYHSLPASIRFFYRRNFNNGFEIFRDFIDFLADRGYDFTYVSTIYKDIYTKRCCKR